MSTPAASSRYSRCRSYIHKRHREQMQLMKDGTGHPFPRLRLVVLSHTFECYNALLIITNCVIIGWQAQQMNPTETEESVNFILEHCFTAAFASELLLRFVAYGWTMVFSSENHLDIFLVSLSVLATWILGPLQVDVTLLRKLTVLRTLRLVHLAAAVRFRPEFKDMWALLKGLYESVETLFWTYVMIGCVLYFFAIVATSLIGKQDAFRDNAIAQEYFGDVLLSMLTLFQVMTLDSWSAIVRDLMKVQSWVVIFFIVFISIAVFVLMNLVTAIIVEHAFSNGKADEQDRAIRLEREKEQELEELQEFFALMDEDKSGKITQEELFNAARQRKVRQKLRALDIMPKDMDDLWDILDDGDGELDVDEFVNGIRRLRGEARAKDILRIQKELRMLESSVDSIEESMDVSNERMRHIESHLQRARSDIAAIQRTVGRAKEAVKIAAKTQRVKEDTLRK